jgi:hypothetical protein
MRMRHFLTAIAAAITLAACASEPRRAEMGHSMMGEGAMDCAMMKGEMGAKGQMAQAPGEKPRCAMMESMKAAKAPPEKKPEDEHADHHPPAKP